MQKAEPGAQQNGAIRRDGILNYCRTKNTLWRGRRNQLQYPNIGMLINRGRGYKNLRYLLLKAQRMVATRTELVAFRKVA